MIPNDALLAQLNRFTRRSHTADEVYLFDLILCDNDIDRDGDCFSDDALAELAKRFVGVTGIFDHDPHAGNQTARIFAAEVKADPERKTKDGRPYRFLSANAYMIRTERNADLIREIEGGIKKEVSVSCAVAKQICSVCGTNRLEQHCDHRKGKTYNGKLCCTVLDGITDVYEWSFVAVPAQRRAGVTKTLGGAASCDPEKETLRRLLDHTAQQLDELTDALRRDVIRLCFRQGDHACAKLLADSVLHCNTAELLALQKSLLLSDESPAQQPQLYPPDAAPESRGVSPYRLSHPAKEV